MKFDPHFLLLSVIYQLRRNSRQIIFILVISVFVSEVNGQSDLDFHGSKINAVDKQKRKQGNWIFFNETGMPLVSCLFLNDSCISPITFYENGDTAFLRVRESDTVEAFVLYNQGRKYFGAFIRTSDSTNDIELEPDSLIDSRVISQIKKYRDYRIKPVYYFAQKAMIEYIYSAFRSSDMTFNKPIRVVLSIGASGMIEKVEFPRTMNNLSPDELRELDWIYSRMPRWQPYFYRNKVMPSKVLLTNNSTLTIMSAG